MSASRSAELENALASSAWFSGLPEEAREAILRDGHLRWVAAGSAVYRQGEPPTGLHAVIEGEVRIITTTDIDTEPIVRIARTGDWLGFLSCVDGGPHTFSAVASVDTRIYCLTPGAVAKIFESDVRLFKLLVMPELAAARVAYRYIWRSLAMTPMQRIAGRLIALGRGVYSFDGAHVPLDRMSQDQLAMSAMVSRQTMNATLKELEALELVELSYNRVRVLNLPELERLAGEP